MLTSSESDLEERAPEWLYADVDDGTRMAGRLHKGADGDDANAPAVRVPNPDPERGFRTGSEAVHAASDRERMRSARPKRDHGGRGRGDGRHDPRYQGQLYHAYPSSR